MKNKILSFFRLRKKSEINSVVFLTLAGKGHHEYVLMPRSFNLEEHIRTYDPYDYGFPRSENYYLYEIYSIFFLFTLIPARNNDLIQEDRLTPIETKKVRKSFKTFKYYIKYLERTNVIKVNWHYIPGEKCRAYGWADRFNNDELEYRYVETRYADDIYKYRAPEEFNYLFYWYNQNLLTINPLALLYAEKVKDYKLAHPTEWDINKLTGKTKNPEKQYDSIHYNFLKIQENRHEVHLDDKIHRFHSVLTNMQKDMRNFIKYDDTPLECIDIVNCQPYLTCLILNPEFWQENSTLPVNFYTLPQNVQQMFPPSLINRIEAFFSITNRNDFNSFIQTATEGNIYETIADIYNSRQKRGQATLDRKQAKTMMFFIFYSRNGKGHKKRSISNMKKLFETSLYPKVSELFSIIKDEYSNHNKKILEKQYARLACLLQAIESQIILKRCCKRIWDEGEHTIPIFTIHDSVATLPQHLDFVKGILTTELSQCVRHTPLFKPESWNESQLEYPDLYNSLISSSQETASTFTSLF